MGRGTRGWGDGGTWRGNMAGWRAPQQPDKTAGSTYFGLRRSVAARPGSELGYAQCFQCWECCQTANLDGSGFIADRRLYSASLRIISSCGTDRTFRTKASNRSATSGPSIAGSFPFMGKISLLAV